MVAASDHESCCRRQRHGHKIRIERWRQEGDATSIREGHAVAAQFAVQAKLWVSDTQGRHKLSILIIIGDKMMADQEEFMASVEIHCGRKRQQGKVPVSSAAGLVVELDSCR